MRNEIDEQKMMIRAFGLLKKNPLNPLFPFSSAVHYFNNLCIVSLILLTLLLSACSASRFNAGREIEAITFLEFVTTPRSNDKALADPVSRSVYALIKAEQQVHIYRDGKLLNSLGGLGTQSYNFQRLTDIALDNDGSLLALDQMAKDLKRFSPDGKLIARLDLSRLVQPELIAMSPDRDLIVYDAASQELICISMLDGSELYRFGKFQLSAPGILNCNRDVITVYSPQNHETQLFYILGQFKESRPGQWLQDVFGNWILAELPIHEIPERAVSMPLLKGSGPALLFKDNIAVVYENGIGIYRIIHRRPQR